MAPRVWLITGASSGFGKIVTELALSKGDIVVATLRKPEALSQLSQRYPKDKLLVVKCDVTGQADIDRAFASAKEAFGRLNVVFNNAGYVVTGDAESTPEDTARALFDVNFWGAVNVSLAAVKFFRDVNEPGQGGVLLQNSSITGLLSVAGITLYSATKHAFDGFTEGLVKELLPKWNIKICIVQPGSFKTEGISKSTVLPVNPAYDDKDSAVVSMYHLWKSPEALSKIQSDPNKFAEAIFRLVESGSIPLYLPIGQDALKMAKEKVEMLGKAISEAAPWSADL